MEYIYDGYLKLFDGEGMYTDNIKEARMFDTYDEAQSCRSFITDRIETYDEEQ